MNNIKHLPVSIDLETKPVLKKIVNVHRYLAELKGIAATIPNQQILIDTLSLQEAKESSAIENIISTFDDIFQSNTNSTIFTTSAAKEIHAYSRALKIGFELVKKNGLLTNNIILDIQQNIEENKAGFRKLPGTKLLNESTGETVYQPPQDYQEIVELMTNLEKYINNDELWDVDPIIKMAVFHQQFESIHPFYDANGRTGRIINILYLIKMDLLSIPILYLSRYIIQHKQDYYLLLQEVRETDQWESWILYMLDAVEQTSKQTIGQIREIKQSMQQYKNTIRQFAPKIYSQDLLNNLFRYPYTKIEYIMHDMNVSRNTAIRYLDQLVDLELIEKKKVGRENYFVNKALFSLLTNTVDVKNIE